MFFHTGPLSRLRLFGFICPCMEGDEELAARMGMLLVERHRWRSSSSDVMRVHFVDGPSGPRLQAFGGDKEATEIDLQDIDRIQLVEDDEGKDSVHIYAATRDGGESTKQSPQKPALVLYPASTNTKNTLTSLELAECLQAIMAWNRERLCMLQEQLEHDAAMQRLRQERQRLLADEEEERI